MKSLKIEFQQISPDLADSTDLAGLTSLLVIADVSLDVSLGLHFGWTERLLDPPTS